MSLEGETGKRDDFYNNEVWELGKDFGGTAPSFEVLYPGDAFLGIAHHLAEEVGEACPAELRGAGTVEVSVIDGFAVGRGAEMLRGSLGGRGLVRGSGRDIRLR